MTNLDFDIIIIGGGAAGFFAAIHAGENSNRKIAILEKTKKLLFKVKISGGGRCNVAHDCYKPAELVKHYPRGGKQLYKAFQKFATENTLNWFRNRGIALKTEDDGRIFPTTDDSQTIIDSLVNAALEKGIEIYKSTEAVSITPNNDGFTIGLKSRKTLHAGKVIVASGGHPHPSAYDWLKALGVQVAPPIPSLFTFNVPDSGLTDLQGVSVPYGSVQIPKTKLKQEGPILITHWGFSGPAVIKLSAFAALELNERNYQFPFLINWCGMEEEEVRDQLHEFQRQNPKKLVVSNPVVNIPNRLWSRLCEKARIGESRTFINLPKKKMNRLVEHLVKDHYEAQGKSTFKEEFVTSGGVELKEVDLSTFECKKIPGLFFVGEILNVDGVTGGFNFQHAWTSGYLAGMAVKSE